MENKINVAELLKDCPKGMELDCTMYDSVTLLNVNDREDITFPIKVLREDGNYIALTKYGQYTYADFAKCVIFPKGKTTWEGFVPPYKFKNGDILFAKSVCDWIFIYKESGNDVYLYKYVSISHNCPYKFITYDDNPICRKKEVSEIRLATEEEKKKLFDTIKENGYKWNGETKSLEKLPKFKAGDKVKRKDADYTYIVTIAKLDDDYYDYVNEDGQCGVIHISTQDDWELVPTKFDITTLKPFESKVLVRHNKNNKWCGSFFSHIDGDFQSHCYKYVTTAGKSYPMCIPYEGNEHLLNKTADCDIFYKNW